MNVLHAVKGQHLQAQIATFAKKNFHLLYQIQKIVNLDAIIININFMTGNIALEKKNVLN